MSLRTVTYDTEQDELVRVEELRLLRDRKQGWDTVSLSGFVLIAIPVGLAVGAVLRARRRRADPRV